MASGAGLNPRGDNPISPEKSLLSRYERTAPPRNPRAPTPIDPKEEEARKNLLEEATKYKIDQRRIIFLNYIDSPMRVL